MPKKSDLESNPHYQNGLYWGNKIADNIGMSKYKTIEGALKAKLEFGKLLETQLGYDESHPDYLENMGIIKALQEALNK